MAQISPNVSAPSLVDGKSVAVTIEHSLMGSLLAVVFFGVLALIDSPFSWLLIKGFILSVSLSAIASIALVGRNANLFGSRDDETSRFTG